jgi:hypothetical protein
MSKEGTRFIAKSIYTKHVLEKLTTRTKRGPTNWMLGLFAGFLAGVIACSPFMNVNPELGKRNAKQEFRAHLNPSIELNTSASDFPDGRGGTPCPHS